MQSVQERIIKQLLDAIESTQTLPWRRGFRQLFPTNLATGEKYRGQNVFMLIASQAMLNYRLSRWIGFVQFQEWREKNRDLWTSDAPPFIKGRGTQISKVSQGKERVKTNFKGEPIYKRAAVAVAEPRLTRRRQLILSSNSRQTGGQKGAGNRSLLHYTHLCSSIC